MNEESPKSVKRQVIEEEIETLNLKLQKAIEDENNARTNQYWLKKRIKIAKDELAQS